MKLIHKTQRGGEITVTGPPVPDRGTAVFPVDEKGFFEAPDAYAEELLLILGSDVIKAPANKGKGSDT